MIRFIIGLFALVSLQLPDDAPMSMFLWYIPIMGLMYWGYYDMKKKGIL